MDAVMRKNNVFHVTLLNYLSLCGSLLFSLI